MENQTLRPPSPPSQGYRSFFFRSVQISLILLNFWVLLVLTVLIIELIMQEKFTEMYFLKIFALATIFVVAMKGAIRESRPLVLTTGCITLALLLMAIFSRQFSTANLLYLLAIVMLSFAFCALIQERRLSHEIGSRLRHRIVARAVPLPQNSGPFNEVVVQNSSEGSTQPVEGQYYKDPPPPYEDCPPPKYEDVANVGRN